MDGSPPLPPSLPPGGVPRCCFPRQLDGFNIIHNLLFTCLLIIGFLAFITTTKAQDILWAYCNTDNNNYTNGSNLNLTLTSLVSNTSISNGFNTTKIGSNRDTVYGSFQCRGDISSQDCRRCADTSKSEIIKQCPNERDALIFYDNCTLHYSGSPFFNPQISRLSNEQNVSNPSLFNSKLTDLMDNLSSIASSDASKFSTGSIAFNDSVNIYGLVQCTRNFPENTCLSCLQNNIRTLSPCCTTSTGARVLALNCVARYETYLFFQPSKANSPVPATRTNSRSSKGRKMSSRNIVLISISVIIASTIAIFFMWRKIVKRRADSKDDEINFTGGGVNSTEEEMEGSESLLFDLATIRIATKIFSDEYKLGEGGFGSVYKGELPDGSDIAVKRLARKSGQGLQELKTEVVLLAKLMHKNLVRLLGFCIQEEEKLLIYEYLPNGSLDKMLFDKKNCQVLEWDKRYNIIIGIARGLLYLHQDSQIRIIHRDLKASNILLDDDMNPKISDFGLARLFGDDKVQENTNRVVGTYGYMAPEYTTQGQYSTKSDVFSFGVLILEIVSGRRNSSFHNSTNLLSYVWHYWNDGKALRIVDTKLGNQWTQSQVLRCIQLGLLCVQQHASHRPSMAEIFVLLNSETVTCRAPSRPAYFVERKKSSEQSVNEATVSANFVERKKSAEQSVNEVTVSDIDPR